MDLLRGILIGIGLFGLLIVGSCTMLGYGTVAVLDKAAEVAEKEAATPEGRARREAAERAVDRFFEEIEESERDRQFYHSADGYDEYAKFGEPTNNLSNR